MPRPNTFPEMFTVLREVLAPFAPHLHVTVDSDDAYSLDARSSDQYPNGLFFGAVQIKKNYVSFHLMPVYVFPDLLDGISLDLRKRMQGKSCFNFARIEQIPRDDLSALASAGFGRYRDERLV